MSPEFERFVTLIWSHVRSSTDWKYLYLELNAVWFYSVSVEENMENAEYIFFLRGIAGIRAGII